MSRHSRGAVGGPYFSLAGRSAEDSWTSCHPETTASFCPCFPLCDCLFLPQSCLCPDRASQRCSSPHHVFKLSGLHFDKCSSGNSITVSHSKNNCNHLWNALEKKNKNQSSTTLFGLLLERTSTAVRVLLIISHKRRRTTLDDKMLFFSCSLIISHYFKSK